MATTRLTRELKSAVITKAIKGFKQAEKDAIEARRVAFGIKLYEYTYGSIEPIVAPLPEIWRVMDEGYNIECDGYETRRPCVNTLTGETGLTGDAEDLPDNMPLGKRRPFPAGFGGATIKVNDKHPLYAEARKIVQDHVKIVRAEKSVREKMAALLATCRTIKHLEAAWPEALQFLPKNVVMTTALVPVGLSDQINKALGIPSKASVATEAVRKAASNT